MQDQRLNDYGLHPTVLETVLASGSEEVGSPDYGQVPGGHPSAAVGQGEAVEVTHQVVQSVQVGCGQPVDQSPEGAQSLEGRKAGRVHQVRVQGRGQKGGRKLPEVELEEAGHGVEVLGERLWHLATVKLSPEGLDVGGLAGEAVDAVPALPSLNLATAPVQSSTGGTRVL